MGAKEPPMKGAKSSRGRTEEPAGDEPAAGKLEPHLPERHIYIAGDNGQFYRISQQQLSENFRVSRDDPNFKNGALQKLTATGVASAGIHQRELQGQQGDSGSVTAGVLVGICALSVHFFNLGIVKINDPPSGKDS